MKKKSPRTERRESERAALKIARQREKLATLEEGGSPERPIAMESASQVEAHARSISCARCGGSLLVAEHTAETIDHARLRVARMTCPTCGARRSVYFRLKTLN